MTRRLDSYHADVTSQGGEDGMLAELIARLGIEHGWCVELGAWDGKHLSNTWTLWNERGWGAVLLEGDHARASALASATSDRPDVHVVEAFVEPEGDRSLDALLATTPIPTTIDVLSIDIDGDDHSLWAGLHRYDARIVVIEYNASFPPEIDFVQPRGEMIGSSGRSICALARRKGFTLLGVTPTNLVFLRDEEVEAAGFEPLDFADAFDDAARAIVYSDYLGHHYVLRPAQWGYQATTLHPERTVRAALRELFAVARRRGASGAPGVARTYRSVRYRGRS